MRLADRDPKLADNGSLRFRCPGRGCTHAIRIPTRGGHWTASGVFPDSFTVSPSIDSGCWHGFIRNGELLDMHGRPMD